MAALVVQSRFAGLKIEDDDHTGNDNQKSKKNKMNPGKKMDPPKKPKTANNKSQVIVLLFFSLLLLKAISVYFIYVENIYRKIIHLMTFKFLKCIPATRQDV